MNSTTLTKMYRVLTPDERASLVLAAIARGDEGEAQRLNDAAPRSNWTLPHHYGVLRAQLFAAIRFQLEQLEAIGMYWFSVGRAESASDEERPDFWIRLALTYAYRYSANLQAWKTFCNESGTDGENLMAGIPGLWLTRLCDVNLPTVAPNREQVAEILRGVGIDADVDDIMTADTLLSHWRMSYTECMGPWA